jgi:hypothetical protein
MNPEFSKYERQCYCSFDRDVSWGAHNLQLTSEFMRRRNSKFFLLSSSSSSSIGRAGGNPAYRTSAFEAVCTFNPVLVPQFISRDAPHQTA